jgi:tRNA (mo5U34)-methyltransferase
MNMRDQIPTLPWFHQIDLGGGVVTPGKIPQRVLKAQADVYFKDGVAGKTVLDIGCWDGFNSFEAKRRGATRVLATDHYAWSPQCWGSRQSFETARAALELDVEAMDIELNDISPERVGTFDVVLFLGVFYHLRHPFLGLEKAASVCSGTIIVETHLDAWFSFRPAMVFYPTTELRGDGSNWWGPNKACVLAMLRDLGFTAEFVRHPTSFRRGIFFGRR